MHFLIDYWVSVPSPTLLAPRIKQSIILAVVSGLVLAASAAIVHDIYVNVIKDGHADQHEQVMAARITSLVVGAVGIVIGLLAEKANVAHLVALAFAVAVSGNLPVVVLSLFWRKFNTAGVISGLVVGTIASIGLVMVSPNMTYPKVVAAGAKKVVAAMEKKQAALLPGQTLTEKDEKALAKAKVDELKGGPLLIAVEQIMKFWCCLQHDRLQGFLQNIPGKQVTIFYIGFG